MALSIAMEVGHEGFAHKRRVISSCHKCGCQVAFRTQKDSEYLKAFYDRLGWRK